MKITWYSHSCFLVESPPYRLLFDPYLTGNPAAPIRAGDVRCTHVFCSHAHEDHIGDTLQIARANDATIVTSYELAGYLTAEGAARTIDLMPGGKVAMEFGDARLTPAIHSCALEQAGGKNLSLGVAAGFVVRIGNTRLYHAGDTALFSDMRLIGRERVDVAMLPIGDFYTMGIDDAVLALEYLCPEYALPMHYNTHEKIMADPYLFAAKGAAAGHRVVVLQPGETWELPG